MHKVKRVFELNKNVLFCDSIVAGSCSQVLTFGNISKLLHDVCKNGGFQNTLYLKFGLLCVALCCSVVIDSAMENLLTPSSWFWFRVMSISICLSVYLSCVRTVVCAGSCPSAGPRRRLADCRRGRAATWVHSS